MSKQFISYQEWPKRVKVLTAVSIKSLLIKNISTIKGISTANIIIGVSVLLLPILLAYIFGTLPEYKEEPIHIMLAFLGAINILLGLFNLLVTSKTIDWVNKNSTWEERFANKSSGEDKLLYFLILIGILFVSYGIAFVLQNYI